MIRPCPFCGSKKVEICRTNEHACWVRCDRCGAAAPGHPDREEAVRIWNKRPKITGEAKITLDGDLSYWKEMAEAGNE